MRGLTAAEHRIEAIREAVTLAGRWNDRVLRVVADALASAFDDGVESAGVGYGRARLRILRLIAREERREREEPLYHRRIAEALGCHRETVSRHVSEMIREGLIERRAGYVRAYRLTRKGRIAAEGSENRRVGNLPELTLTDDEGVVEAAG